MIAAALFVTALLPYWQAGGFGFVNYDDFPYVAYNPRVQAGLTAESIAWAFTTSDMANWHPLTWLSYMLDSTLFGTGPAGYHITNVALHALNTMLLFFVLLKFRALWWRAALVAALFALHPLHVESVAWISERKDVLSTFFGLLAIWMYAGWVQNRSVARYATLLVCFALSLMSKPMLVTLPCVLLLLDYWPLRRTRWLPPLNDTLRRDQSYDKAKPEHSSVLQLIVEKITLFALAAASSLITMLVQRGAMQELQDVSLASRVGNALVAYTHYLFDTVWPLHLAVLYPHPGAWPAATVALAALLLGGITALALWQARTRPHLIVGWLWFLGTLVPVVGIIQVGEQARADRYTYVPLIGLFIMLAWSVPVLDASRRTLARAIAAVGVAALVALGALAWRQASFWKSSRALFERALAVTQRNHTAHNNLGIALVHDGELDEAMRHFEEAIVISPRFAAPYVNLGDAHATRGNSETAIELYLQALQHKPDFAVAHNSLAAVYSRQGRLNEAIEHFESALQFDPSLRNIHSNLAQLYQTAGRIDDAIAHFQKALAINPQQPDVLRLLANAQLSRGDSVGAIQTYRKLLALTPNDANVCHNLAYLLVQQPQLALGEAKEALRLAQRACALTNNQPQMLATLAGVQAAIGDAQAALATAQTALDGAIKSGDDETAEQLRAWIAQMRGQVPNVSAPH